MSSTNNTLDEGRKLAHKIIRWRGILPLLLIAVCAALYCDFLFDLNLKSIVETIASNENGAAVNIDSLHTNFFKRTVDIEKIQIGHPSLPMRNLLQLDHIHVTFQLAPLFRKKLLVQDMEITGVHYFNRRDVSGFQPFDIDAPPQPVSFLDRVASGLYGSIRNEISENPLRHLGPLSTGLDLKAKIEGMHHDLKTVQELTKLREQLDESESKWQTLTRTIPTPGTLAGYRRQLEDLSQGRVASLDSKELASLTQSIQDSSEATEKASQDVEAEITTLSQQLSNLDSYINADIAAIRSGLDLPRTDLDDLTPLVFGPRVLSYLERISYWLDLSRRKMPTGTKSGPHALIVIPRTAGASVHFGKLAGSPSFLLKHVGIHSEFDPQDPTQGKVEGSLDGFTLDPTIYGWPTKLSLTADFPKSGILGLKLTAQIDHVGAVPHEEFDFTIPSLLVDKWEITKSEDFQFSIAKAHAVLEAHGKFDDNQLLVSWKTAFNDVDYGVKSRYKQTEEILKNIVSGIYNFELVGEVGGPINHLHFTAESDLGKQLAQAFRHEFRHELTAIDDTLRSQILDEVTPDKDALLEKLEDTRQKVLAPIELTKSELRDIAGLSDKVMGTMKSGRRSHHPRRHSEI